MDDFSQLSLIKSAATSHWREQFDRLHLADVFGND